MRSNHLKRMMNARRQNVKPAPASDEPTHTRGSSECDDAEDCPSLSNRDSVSMPATRRRWLRGFSMLRRSSEVVGAITTAKIERENQTECHYSAESLHTLAVLDSSLRASQSPAATTCTCAVVLSWMVLCLQLLMISFLATGYQFDWMFAKHELLMSRFADCSTVDRCDYWSTNFVCMGRVRSLRMSGAKTKGCTECPGIDKFEEALGGNGLCDFASVDDLAAVYFDFWALSSPDSIWDRNGPFKLTCSQKRSTSFDGRAGKYHACVDCFGKPCDQRIYVDDPDHLDYVGPDRQHHCRERYACDAFDYDDGRCDPEFFKVICTRNATTYPRRFSEMPGLGFLRNWPNNYSHSCDGTPRLDNRTLLTASDRQLDPAEYLLLEQLCYLHSTCVRNERAAGCPATEGEKLRRKSREQFRADDRANLWSTGLPYCAHTSKSGLPRISFLLVAAAVLFVVATEIAAEHHGALLCLMWLDIISRRQNKGQGSARCCNPWQIALARTLNVLRWQVLVSLAPWCTVLAVFSSQTSFNIILNGFVSVVILQMDSQVFFALYTEPQFMAMREDYRLVLGREEEQMLRRKIWAVTLTAWISMVALYLALPLWTEYYLTSNYFFKQMVDQLFVSPTGMIVFPFLKAIQSTVLWCFSRDKSGSRRCCVQPRALLRQICHDILWSLFSVLMILLITIPFVVLRLGFEDPRVRLQL